MISIDAYDVVPSDAAEALKSSTDYLIWRGIRGPGLKHSTKTRSEVWCRCTIAVHLIAPKFALKRNEADGSGQGANVKSSYTSKTLAWRFKGVRNKGAELMLAYLGHFQIDMLILIACLWPCSIPTSATEGVVCLTDCRYTCRYLLVFQPHALTYIQ